MKQASKILNIEDAEVRFNSEWLGKMSGPDFLRLSSKYTIARMMERDDFKSDIRRGILFVFTSSSILCFKVMILWY